MSAYAHVSICFYNVHVDVDVDAEFHSLARKVKCSGVHSRDEILIGQSIIQVIIVMCIFSLDFLGDVYFLIAANFSTNRN